MGDGLAAAWVMEHLAHVAATSQRVFSNAQFVAVASDGRRLGSPAEETNLYMIWQLVLERSEIKFSVDEHRLYSTHFEA